ncbi:glycoside hydrolase family 99-like domain-containing protein [Methylorubrum sp. B1-46]|uniref:glycoside hydrolase family 99-like domain-containing protein n=1 Tax=Methylorubrum sp. B1-46 TaxID=2897334 RepID=UPI001E36C1F8|nr:glycoside hydrolase family 99-like domain-containing protein [Methylorubrum sp. B1-46]UGB24879.1 glycoside hydrolase family 99-like domain-containing protein [Methylorubrum sp. B1-46]
MNCKVIMESKLNTAAGNEGKVDEPSAIYDPCAEHNNFVQGNENKLSITSDGSVTLLLPGELELAGKLALVNRSGRTIAAVEAVREVRGYRAKFSLGDFMTTGVAETATTAEFLLATAPVELRDFQTNKMIAACAIPNLIFARAERYHSLIATTADLHDFRGPVQYRGVLDRFSDTALSGWALNATSLQSVEVVFELEGLSIGSAAASLERPDISAVLGRLANCGFSVAASSLRHSVPTEVLALLKTLAENYPNCYPDFRVRVIGTDYVIAPSFTDKPPLSSREWLSFLQPNPGLTKTKLAARSDMVQDLTQSRGLDSEVKIIAFYLPQFHPTAENDAWWGPGFTEWNNVSIAKPMFEGHYQPHIPADLGFYDLRLPETRKAQAKLAREHGIYGFCYYYYWFSGQRILERPLQEVLESGEPDFPFCICWANESWSRRWDGSESELLIAQEHDPEKDIQFIYDILPLIMDPRYITVDGQPIIIIYRVGLMPDPRRVFSAWKAVAQENGLPGLHICMAETFGAHGPYQHGCDSAVEFPPHKIVSEVINAEIPDLPSDFTGNVYDYQQVIQNDLLITQPPYTRYRTVMPSWDNTSRRGKAGNIVHGATPELYETWLRQVVADTKHRFVGDQRIVFINAWNEWAEGTHLEPDRKNGRSLLEVTRRATSDQSDWRVLLDGLRLRNQVTSEEMPQVLQALEARFSGLQSSTDFLSRKLKDPSIAWGQSIFTDKVPISIQNKPVITTGVIELERINQYWSGTWHVLRREEHLSVQGWSFVPSVPLDPRTNSFFTLLDSQTGLHHYAVAWDRSQRPDVIAGANANPQDALWSGFSIVARLADVPPGEYVLAMTYAASECAFQAVSRWRIVLV